MDAVQNSKVKRVLTLNGVLDEYEEVWNGVPSFVRAKTDLGNVIPAITGAVQSQLSSPAVAAEKDLVRMALVDMGAEVAAAVFVHAEENDDAELAGRVDFSRSQLARSRDGELVAHCRDFHAAAAEIQADLADQGMTPAKLTAFKKQIDGFENWQTKPRQKQAKRRAATRSLSTLILKADQIVNRRLNKLVVQFRKSAPDFYHAYQTAVSIVDAGGGSAAKDDGNGGTPAPTPAPL